jgi:methoxymalonate biosynthesis protein
MDGVAARARVAAPPRLIKCVVWDLDDTLWAGAQAEGASPEPHPAVLAVLDRLAARGIIHSVASRNDPAVGARLLAAPELAGRFVAPQIGWEPKDKALRHIAATLNIGLDSLAFVDDSPFERAAVAHLLPQVLVLAPEDVPDLPDRPEFQPGPLTAEAARRSDLYQQEAVRREAEAAFAGSRLDFLRACAMRLHIAPATSADLPRIHEMVLRTNQLNSTGARYTLDEVARRVADPARFLCPVARLTDRFGDYGLIGAALVDRQGTSEGGWLVELLMLSCRVEGRGIPAALLRWLLDQAQRAGTSTLAALYRPTPQNRQMAVLLRSLGFRADGPAPGADPLTEGATVFRRATTNPPSYPEWLQIVGAA